MRAPADRIAMLDVLYGVRIGLTPDGLHLDVAGPSDIVRAAFPTLCQHRVSLLAHLHQAAADASGKPKSPEVPRIVETRFEMHPHSAP